MDLGLIASNLCTQRWKSFPKNSPMLQAAIKRREILLNAKDQNDYKKRWRYNALKSTLCDKERPVNYKKWMCQKEIYLKSISLIVCLFRCNDRSIASTAKNTHKKFSNGSVSWLASLTTPLAILITFTNTCATERSFASNTFDTGPIYTLWLDD